MKRQRPNLAEIAAAAGSTRNAVRQPAAPSADSVEAAPASERPRTRSRGTKQIAAHFPAEVAWQLRELAVERRSTVQALLGEALNDLFQKHGM